MKHILSFIVIMLSLSAITAQDVNSDNQVWQSIERDTLVFRLPPTWDNFGNIWQSADDAYQIRYVSDTAYDNLLEDIFEDQSALTEEIINLPIGDTTQLVSDDETAIAYIVSSNDGFSALVGEGNADTTLHDLMAQVANTMAFTTQQADSWSLYATIDANLFLRVPSNWMQQGNSDTLTVTETFDDISISVRYRDLGRAFELSEVEQQFADSYTNNAYIIQEQTTINLPSGDALFFSLGNVPITDDLVHQQWHIIIARDNFMIVLVASGNQQYFEEYEPVLEQIVDTFQFVAP